VLKIGPVQLETNLLFAPIAGYSDLAFRIACRSFNDDEHAAPGFSGRPAALGLASTDLISPHGLLRGNEKSLDLARTNDDDKPVGVQLYGSDPELLARAAAWAGDHGATLIDINMGCPVDKVTKRDGGSKLMVPDEGHEASECRSFSAAILIAQAVRAALPDSIPLTCKMRLGWSCADDAPRLACELIDVGVAGITVHGRTTVQKFRGSADWSKIKDVVDAVHAKSARWAGGPIPVIGNGDVREPEDAARMIAQTGCDGVMIGRAALGAPWIFRDAWAYLATGSRPPEVSVEEKTRCMRRYFAAMREFRGDQYAMHQITGRASWFCKRMHAPGESIKPFHEALRLAQTPEEIVLAFDEFTRGGLRGQCRSALLTTPE